MTVSSGGTVSKTTVTDGAVYLEGGKAISATLNSNAYFIVSSGAVAQSATVNSSGYVNVSSGAVIQYATVNSGGVMDIDGDADHITVNPGGTA